MKKMMMLLTVFMGFLFNSHLIYAAEVKKVDLNLDRNEIAYSFLELQTGEAALLQTGTGTNILINTGGKGTKKQLMDRLNMYNIEKLDSLILTNAHQDYTANLSWLKKEFDIEEIILPQHLKDELVNKFELDKEITTAWETNDSHEIVPGLYVKVLFEKSEKVIDKKNGMVLSFDYGSLQMLYMGTADEEIETKLVNSDYPMKAEILKVGDFAATGTSQYFLEKINPEVAIIFHQHDKGPSQEVIERLNETWIDIYQTRQFGNITIKCDQENYKVITIHG